MKLKVRLLKHKKYDVFGNMVYLSPDVCHIWPSTVPDIFLSTVTIDSLREINQKRGGNWKEEIDNYEMVEANLEVVNN